MFNLSSAIVIGLVVVGVVQLAKSLVYGDTKQRVTTAICIVIGIGTVLLVGASDFAHEQVLLNHTLDSLNVWSQILLGVLVAGVASTVWEIGSKALSNIGQNQT